jgi:hypothetical protein
MRILLIEDDDLQARILVELLTQQVTNQFVATFSKLLFRTAPQPRCITSIMVRIIKKAPQNLQRDPSLKSDMNPRFVIVPHGNKTLNTNTFRVSMFLPKLNGP